MLFKSIIVSVLAAASAMMANAAPLATNNLIVVNPHITSPYRDMVWKIGSTHTVTWGTCT
jgi:hypothetical protein